MAVDTQYNGKRLLNGLYGLRKTTMTVRSGYIEPPTEYTLYKGETYTKTVNADGSRKIEGRIVGVNKIKDLLGGFNAVDSSIQSTSNLQSKTWLGNGYVYADLGFDGINSQWNWADSYKENKFTVASNNVIYFENDASPSDPQRVIRAFMYSLEQTKLTGFDAFDEAIDYCTGGTIKTKNDLVANFMNDLNNSATAADFLLNYCDIDLTNVDTGAITGSDAGGSTTKTAESVVPENSSPPWTTPTPGSSTTINGLRVYWPTTGASGALTAAEQHIMAGLNSEWINQSVALVNQSYGINFNTQGVTVRTINVKFENNSTNNFLAYVTSRSSNGITSSLDLTVNMHYYNDIDTASADGILVPTSSMYRSAGYLDRTIAHEFTHAIMAANINYFGNLPLYVVEGTAELTHGIDDERAYTINKLLTADKSTLQSVLNSGGSVSDGEAPYAAGYMLLRYLAKQGQGQQISKLDPVYAEKFVPSAPTSKEMAIEIDFSKAYNGNGTKLKFPDSFDEQGFCILCGACEQYINFTFDKDMDMGTSKLDSKLLSSGIYQRNYTIGIGGATSTSDLAKALFQGIAAAPKDQRLASADVYVEDANGNQELVCVGIDRHNLRIAKNPNYPDGSSSEYVFLKDYSPTLLFKEARIIDALGDEGSKDDAPAGTTIQMLDDDGNQIFDEDGNQTPYKQTFTVSQDTTLHVWEPRYIDVPSSESDPLIIHGGTQANQHVFYYINDMQTKSLTAGKIFQEIGDDDDPSQALIHEYDRARYQSFSDTDKQNEWLETLKAAENMSVDDISLATVKDANIAIRVLDGALEYALDIATTLGSYLQRLEVTGTNIVTTEENTIASESTIRDADMAKEMVDYTKANILSQASQAMLAQANQSSAGILDLIR